ncbi:CPBP family intramembrane metalloprotease [Ureibacillus chungkukjangi]|uniref:CPBP family intramembrane glutamic endopeptidase n=1 Tax=Ureibacillus chungkukjangi TaxID=1202712 RepID=UPI00384C14D9
MLTLLEVFVAYLFVKYKQGKIDHNPIITIILKEWKILFYAFFRWKRNKVSSENSFSLHKNSSYFWLFIALLHEQIIEMIVFHIYFKKVEPSYAYVFSGLHLYSILYMLGDYNWVRNTPVCIKNNVVEMKIGARREISFHIRDIRLIRKAEIAYSKNGAIIHEKDVFHLTVFPRVLTRIFGITEELKHEIVFKEPISYKGYFGLKKKVSKVLIYIEDSNQLVNILEKKMEDLEEEDESIQEDKVVTNKKSPLIQWEIYLTLVFLNVLGALAMAPYAIAREGYHKEMGISEWLFTLIFSGQMLLEAAILLFLALLMGKSVKIKMPILETIFSKKNVERQLLKKVGMSVIYGIMTSIVIMIVSYFISYSLGIDNSSINEPVWWLGTLGSFGAGITEETIFRLFLVTAIIWLLTKAGKGKIPIGFSIWTAIIFAALIFGLLHYGVAASTYEMTLGLFLGMLLINGIGGIVFGALFVYIGIEFAMIAHFIADIIIHVVAPLFI